MTRQALPTHLIIYCSRNFVHAHKHTMKVCITVQVGSCYNNILLKQWEFPGTGQQKRTTPQWMTSLITGVTNHIAEINQVMTHRDRCV